MSTSLANPRRTQLASWPTQATEHPEQERPVVPADSTASAADDQGTGQ
ncbi:hypothetical protein [Actinomadura rugatobispora]|uniref:Uncharacterized protein n=1 Tax=Actinomadura rugatobispora TaxID=1994 RepID=A0ABW0ZRB3_9ACTN